MDSYDKLTYLINMYMRYANISSDGVNACNVKECINHALTTGVITNNDIEKYL